MCELVFCLAVEVLLNIVGDELAEFLFALYHAFTKHFVKEVLIELSRLEAQNLADLEVEVRLHLLCLFLCDVKQAGEFSSAAVVGLCRIEGDDVTQLGTFELCLLLLVLHVLGKHDCILDGNAVLECVVLRVELCECTLHHVASLVALSLYMLAATLTVALYLLIYQSIINLDAVVCELVLLGELGVEVWSECDVECEGKVILRLEVHLGSLLFVWKGLSQHVDLVLADVFVDFFAEELVDFLCLHFCTKALLDERCRHFSRTETWQACLMAEVLQCLLYLFFVVCLLDVEGKQGAHLVDVLK